MPTIQFGSWAPDAYDLNSPLAGEAKGVLPGGNSYHPWPSLASVSAALGSACIGAFVARTSAGTYTTFAGTRTKLYKYSTTAAWSDVSGATYNVPTDEFWSFAQYGNVLYVTNGGDGVQSIDIDVGTTFAPATGSPPVARYVKTVGDFLMLGRTAGYPTGIEWSALNDATYWTHGQRSSDFQLFPDGGFVNGITPLEAGLIFQETAIRRFAQTQDASVFNFARVEDGQGLVAPNSLATRGTTSFYFGRNGFRRIGPDTGYSSVPIGLEVVDKWFQDNIESQRLYVIQGVADPLKPRLFWLAPSAGNTSSILDICLCYDDGLKQWTHADISASCLIAAATPGISMDDLDSLYPNLDLMTPSLDSPAFMGGVPYVAGFDSDFKLAFFNGANLAAIVQTAEFQPMPGKRVFISGFRPVTDSPDVTGRIAGRERLQDTAVFTTSASLNAQGFIPQRISTKFARAEVAIAAGSTYTHLQGIDLNPEDMVQDGIR